MSTDRTDRPSGAPIVLVTPIVPLPGSNGLAMRAGMWLDALAGSRRPVHVVVVPVAGPTEPSAWSRVGSTTHTVVTPVRTEDAHAHVVAQLGDPGWRAALEAAAPLPARAALAPPSLAADAAQVLAPAIDGTAPCAVVTMREYLAPFGIALANALGAARVVVDLDDDVEPLLAALGEADEAAAYGRLARAWLPRADAVTVASPVEADAVAARYGLASVHVVANSVRPAARISARPNADRLLFVGNLTYPPNVAAATTLAEAVLPAVRAERPAATLDLVGHASEPVAALGALDGVTVHGFAVDLDRHYAAADVVVAPLTVGAGTRIKVLEAFAHARPVVATPAAVAGLAVRDGHDLLVAPAGPELVAAVVRVLADAPLADRLVRSATATVSARYAPDVVAPLVRRIVLGDDAGAEA